MMIYKATIPVKDTSFKVEALFRKSPSQNDLIKEIKRWAAPYDNNPEIQKTIQAVVEGAYEIITDTLIEN